MTYGLICSQRSGRLLLNCSQFWSEKVFQHRDTTTIFKCTVYYDDEEQNLNQHIRFTPTTYFCLLSCHLLYTIRPTFGTYLIILVECDAIARLNTYIYIQNSTVCDVKVLVSSSNRKFLNREPKCLEARFNKLNHEPTRDRNSAPRAGPPPH